MNKVKRYENDYGAIMGSDDGEFVTYEDYAALEQKFTDLAVQLANAESKCRELAGVVAENSTLKSAINFAEPWLPTCDDGLLHRIELTKQTPATDAFLAEVRASGVEMFGQYHNFSEKLFIQKEAQKFAAKLRQGAKS